MDSGKMPQPDSNRVDCVVIGAGLSGLSAAHMLQNHGQQVVVLDKGRGPGGRLSNRRFGGTVADHGAQYFTVRSEIFLKQVLDWEARGIVTAWGSRHGETCWRGSPVMTALTSDLAEGLDVRQQVQVKALVQRDTHWEIKLAEGDALYALCVVLTAPVPQALELMAAGGFLPDGEYLSILKKVEYHRCIAVMATLDGPSGIPAPGMLQLADEPVAWIADNHQKGISDISCVTIHATHEFSMQHWDDDRVATGEKLVAQAAPWLRANVIEQQVHGWKFSRPASPAGLDFLELCEGPRLVLAGDGLCGGRVESVYLSGRAAAERILSTCVLS